MWRLLTAFTIKLQIYKQGTVIIFNVLKHSLQVCFGPILNIILITLFRIMKMLFIDEDEPHKIMGTETGIINEM
jgi:hypothetical protein